MSVAAVAQYLHAGHIGVAPDYFSNFVENVQTGSQNNYIWNLKRWGAAVVRSCVKATFCGCYAFPR